MTPDNIHIIAKHLLHLRFPAKEGHFQRQQRISKVYWETLVPKMAALFDRFVGPEELIRLTNLEVDLGSINWKNFEEEFVRRALEELELKLTQLIKLKDSKIHRLPLRRSLFLQWLYFLEHGVMDWRASTQKETDLHKAVLDTLGMESSAIEQLRALTQNNQRAKDRLILQHNDHFLKTLIELYTGKNQNLLPKALAESQFFFNQLASVSKSQPHVLTKAISHDPIRFAFWTNLMKSTISEGHKRTWQELVGLFLIEVLAYPEETITHKQLSATIEGNPKQYKYLGPIIKKVLLVTRDEKSTPPQTSGERGSERDSHNRQTEIKNDVASVADLQPDDMNPANRQGEHQQQVFSDEGLPAITASEIVEKGNKKALPELQEPSRIQEPTEALAENTTESLTQPSRGEESVVSNQGQSKTVETLNSDLSAEERLKKETKPSAEELFDNINANKKSFDAGHKRAVEVENISQNEATNLDTHKETTDLSDNDSRNDTSKAPIEKGGQEEQQEKIAALEMENEEGAMPKEENRLLDIDLPQKLNKGERFNLAQEAQQVEKSKDRQVIPEEERVGNEPEIAKAIENQQKQHPSVQEEETTPDITPAEPPGATDETKIINLLAPTIDLEDSLDPLKLDNEESDISRQQVPKVLESTPKVHPSPQYMPTKALAIGTSFFIQNAGVVLLHPFLASYFRSFELVQDIEFADEMARHKAIHLIQYFATCEIRLPEYELILPKYLCSLPFDIPIEREVDISAAEREEAENLLQAAINHWGALGKASPDALREGFLQRAGKLEKRESGWYLTVEQKTLDILLGKLPWNLSIIKLPWMKELLKVEWA